MLVKVHNKLTGQDQFVTKRVLNSATSNKNFELISEGHPDDANIYDPKKEYPKSKKESDAEKLAAQQREIEALKAQLAAKQTPVNSDESTEEKPKGKPGRKPKTISSSDVSDEV